MIFFKDRLVYLIHRSLLKIKESDPSSSFADNLQDFLGQDPLGRTIVESSRESKQFTNEIRTTIALMEQGVRQPHSEESKKLHEMLNRGQIVDERFVIPPHSEENTTLPGIHRGQFTTPSRADENTTSLQGQFIIPPRADENTNLRGIRRGQFTTPSRADENTRL